MKNTIFRSFIFSMLFGVIVFNFVCTGEKPPLKPPVIGMKDTSKYKSINSRKYVNIGSQHLNGIMFITPFKGIAVGNNGTVIISRNSGNKWTTPVSITPKNLFSVCAADTSIIVAVGQDGIIMRTTDGGTSWDTVTVNTFPTLRAVSFLTSVKGYAAGDGVVCSTTDGGSSWTQVYSDSLQRFSGISYNSGGDVFIVGMGGLILKGPAFTQVIISSVNLNSIHFALASNYFTHQSTGFIVGNGGKIFKTTDDGVTWSISDSVTANGKNLRSVFMTNTHWGYAVGNAGTVLRYNGQHWKLITAQTSSNLNGVDNGESYSDAELCVGDDGTVGIECPDPVLVNSVTPITTTNCTTWSFDLTLEALTQTETDPSTGEPITITFDSFSVSSSQIINQDIAAGRGWAVHDNYVSVQFEDLEPGPASNHYQANNFIIIYDPAGEIEYITCCLKDVNGNPWLLSKYQCPP